MTRCVVAKISVAKVPSLLFGVVLFEGLCWDKGLFNFKGLFCLEGLNRLEEVRLEKEGGLDVEGVRHEAKSTLFMKISSFM